MSSQALRLVADIGGTNARFALARADGTLREPRTLATRRYASLDEAASDYLRAVSTRPREACVAVAGPVSGDLVRLTNHRWEFSITATRAALGLTTLRVINDFEAIALALPALVAGDVEKIGGDTAVRGRPMAVLGPGTRRAAASSPSPQRADTPR